MQLLIVKWWQFEGTILTLIIYIKSLVGWEERYMVKYGLNPRKFTKGAAREKSRGLKPNFTVYLNLSPITDIISLFK